MFRKESQKPRHGNKRCDEWRIEAGICGSLRPRRNKPRRGVAIAGAAAGSFALGALALGLLVIARRRRRLVRSEEHTSELQSLMRISYAVLCLKKKHSNWSRKHYRSGYEE